VRRSTFIRRLDVITILIEARKFEACEVFVHYRTNAKIFNLCYTQTLMFSYDKSILLGFGSQNCSFVLLKSQQMNICIANELTDIGHCLKTCLYETGFEERSQKSR